MPQFSKATWVTVLIMIPMFLHLLHGVTCQVIRYFPLTVMVTAEELFFYDNSWIYANNPSDQKSISKLTSGQINDLALAVFVNCNSGSGGSNLLSTTVNRGGDAAVGFTGEITKFQADYWTQRFWYRLNQYSTIQDAAYYAKVDTLNTYWYLGSGGIDTVTWQGPGVSNTIKPARAGS